MSTYRSKKYTFVKRTEFFSLSFPLLLRVFVVFCPLREMVVDVSFFGAKTCSHLLDS